DDAIGNRCKHRRRVGEAADLKRTERVIIKPHVIHRPGEEARGDTGLNAANTERRWACSGGSRAGSCSFQAASLIALHLAGVAVARGGGGVTSPGVHGIGGSDRGVWIASPKGKLVPHQSCAKVGRGAPDSPVNKPFPTPLLAAPASAGRFGPKGNRKIVLD